MGFILVIFIPYTSIQNIYGQSDSAQTGKARDRQRQRQRERESLTNVLVAVLNPAAGCKCRFPVEYSAPDKDNICETARGTSFLSVALGIQLR